MLRQYQTILMPHLVWGDKDLGILVHVYVLPI